MYLFEQGELVAVLFFLSNMLYCPCAYVTGLFCRAAKPTEAKDRFPVKNIQISRDKCQQDCQFLSLCVWGWGISMPTKRPSLPTSGNTTAATGWAQCKWLNCFHHSGCSLPFSAHITLISVRIYSRTTNPVSACAAQTVTIKCLHIREAQAASSDSAAGAKHDQLQPWKWNWCTEPSPFLPGGSVLASAVGKVSSLHLDWWWPECESLTRTAAGSPHRAWGCCSGQACCKAMPQAGLLKSKVSSCRSPSLVSI